MGSYKASRNDEEDFYDDYEGGGDEPMTEEEKKAAEKERSNRNNARTAKAAVKVAKNAPHPIVKAAAIAIDKLDDATGGEIANAAGKLMTQANKVSPGGKKLQKTSNQASESGATDVVGKVADAKSATGGSGGSGGGGANASSGASNASSGASNASSGAANKSPSSNGGNANQSGNNGGNSTNDSKNSKGTNAAGRALGQKIKKASDKLDSYLDKITDIPQKVYAAIFFCILLVFMMLFMLFVQKDHQNLALTNETVMAKSNAGSIKCTSDQISQKAVMIGDSRFVGMQGSVGDSEATYIAKSAEGLSWFNSTALPELEAKLTEDETAVVILGLGINDMHNIDNYITAYNQLIEKYPKGNYFILSINPVDEVKGRSNNYYVTNASIESFNQKMQAAFPERYVDLYSELKSDFGTSDGVHYDIDTYKRIYELILSKISTGYNVFCSVGSISSIDESSLSGGGGKILSPGQSLLSLLGQEKIDSWTASIKSDVQAAGVGSGGAPAIAAYGLVQGALNEGIVIPYFWGGGHGAIPYGIDGSWGSSRVIGVGGSNAQPKGSTQASGMDCSGFVSWALKNGGCSNFTPILASDFKSLGSRIDPSQATVGDIAASNTHVMIILNNTGSSLVIAEAKGAKYGIIFEEYAYSHFGNYKIVSMSDYYAKNCNG